jgi:HEPN domain-containing protein
MTVSQFVQQWTEQAAHDLEAARSNRQNGFYDTCIVLCQQSTEKYLKALWAHQKAATPPRSHDLAPLAQAVGAPANMATSAGNLSDEYLAMCYPDPARGTPFWRYAEADAGEHLLLAEELEAWVRPQVAADMKESGGKPPHSKGGPVKVALQCSADRVQDEVAARFLRQVWDEIERCFAPEHVILFGSRATGRARPDSDIDLILVSPGFELRARGLLSEWGTFAGRSTRCSTASRRMCSAIRPKSSR